MAYFKIAYQKIWYCCIFFKNTNEISILWEDYVDGEIIDLQW